MWEQGSTFKLKPDKTEGVKSIKESEAVSE